MSIPESGLRLVSLIEATTLTGPARPLLMFSELCSRCKDQGPLFEHLVVTTRRPAKSFQDTFRMHVEAAGATFRAIPEQFAGDPRVLPKLADAIEEFSADVIETHDSKCHFLLFLLRLAVPGIRSIPWVAFHHGYTRTSWRVRAYQQLDRLTLRSADRVNTFCGPFAKQLQKRGVPQDRLTIITNAVTVRDRPDYQAIGAQRSSRNIGDEEIVILSVGRLSKEKGHADLIRAFASLVRQSSAPLRLILAGDGPERASLEQLAAPLEHQVIFTGQLEDPWPLYHATDIFVLPSHSEGSPLVLFEAMAAELPIVATRVGGVPEVIDDDVSGLLVPSSDFAALASAMEQLINDKQRRLGIASAARAALANYTPDVYARKLLAIYNSAMN